MVSLDARRGPSLYSPYSVIGGMRKAKQKSPDPGQGCQASPFVALDGARSRPVRRVLKPPAWAPFPPIRRMLTHEHPFILAAGAPGLPGAIVQIRQSPKTADVLWLTVQESVP